MTFAFLVIFQIFLSGFSGQRLEKLRRVINLGGGIRWVENKNPKLVLNVFWTPMSILWIKIDIDFVNNQTFERQIW